MADTPSFLYPRISHAQAPLPSDVDYLIKDGFVEMVGLVQRANYLRPQVARWSAYFRRSQFVTTDQPFGTFTERMIIGFRSEVRSEQLWG